MRKFKSIFLSNLLHLSKTSFGLMHFRRYLMQKSITNILDFLVEHPSIVWYPETKRKHHLFIRKKSRIWKVKILNNGNSIGENLLQIFWVSHWKIEMMPGKMIPHFLAKNQIFDTFYNEICSRISSDFGAKISNMSHNSLVKKWWPLHFWMKFELVKKYNILELCGVLQFHSFFKCFSIRLRFSIYIHL